MDPQAHTARADPGVLLGRFDLPTQAHALATTMGVNSDIHGSYERGPAFAGAGYWPVAG